METIQNNLVKTGDAVVATETELTKSEKISLGTKEISKRIRTQLKTEFPNCKFSVTTEYYAGGSAITICLMKADRKVIRDASEISEEIFMVKEAHDYTREQIKERQAAGNHQLNQYTLRDDFKEDSWCNGVFLTEEGHKLMQRVVAIQDQYNYDNSDVQTDYFDVKFYAHFNIGKWNKDFQDGAK